MNTNIISNTNFQKFNDIISNVKEEYGKWKIADSAESRQKILSFFESLHNITKKDGFIRGSRVMTGTDDNLFHYRVEWHPNKNTKKPEFWLSYDEPTEIEVVFRNKPDHRKLATLLKEHDWTFEFSDDSRAWYAGRKEKDEIVELAKNLINLPVNEKEQIINLANITKGQCSNWFFNLFLSEN